MHGETTLEHLIDTLNGFLNDGVAPTAPVRLAIQPSWPFAHSTGAVALDENASDGPILYIGAGPQLGYLPDTAHAALSEHGDW